MRIGATARDLTTVFPNFTFGLFCKATVPRQQIMPSHQHIAIGTNSFHTVDHKTIISEVVTPDLCIGCGVCAGVCPSKVLMMGFARNGDLRPSLQDNCPPSCDACLTVCPFGENVEDEGALAAQRFSSTQDIAFDEVAGFHLQSFVGHVPSPSARAASSSGGIGTWLLANLLTSGEIDAAICVAPISTEPNLFSYCIIKNAHDLSKTASSRYHPLSIHQILRQIQSEKRDQRYAIVGLPCALKGIELASQRFPRLKRRILYKIGLVCGHLPNRFYTQYLAHLSGLPALPESNFANVRYRIKDGIRFANQYLFEATDHDGRTGLRLPFKGRVHRAWTQKHFQFNACNYCEDVFAEIADATLMDAWLPRYNIDPRGHTIITIRNRQLLRVFEAAAKEDHLQLSPISIDQVTASQAGQISNKRIVIRGRLHHAITLNQKKPTKRSSPDHEIFRRYRLLILLERHMQQQTKVLWQHKLDHDEPLWLYHVRLFPVSLLLYFVSLREKIVLVMRQPGKIVKLIPAPLQRLIRYRI